MAKITAIKTQKKSGRVNIYLDGEFSLGISEELLVDFDLYRGRELSEEEIKKIKEADSFSKCRDSAYRFLSYRPRSEKEIVDKLSEKFTPDVIEVTIRKLKEMGYLNDEEFARIWANDRKSSRGNRALSAELFKKGVSKEIIDKVLFEVRDEQYENAKNLVSSKSKYCDLSENDAYKKVVPFLLRRGFSYDVIKKVVEELYQ